MCVYKLIECLRPLARSSANAAIFAPATDPALVQFENSITNSNHMYMMKTIGYDCSDLPLWDRWLSNGKEGLQGDIPVRLVCADEDGVFSVEDSKALATFLGVPEEHFYTIRGCGHNIMLEKPKELFEIVITLLS